MNIVYLLIKWKTTNILLKWSNTRFKIQTRYKERSIITRKIKESSLQLVVVLYEFMTNILIGISIADFNKFWPLTTWLKIKIKDNIYHNSLSLETWILIVRLERIWWFNDPGINRCREKAYALVCKVYCLAQTSWKSFQRTLRLWFIFKVISNILGVFEGCKALIFKYATTLCRW